MIQPFDSIVNPMTHHKEQYLTLLVSAVKIINCLLPSSWFTWFCKSPPPPYSSLKSFSFSVPLKWLIVTSVEQKPSKDTTFHLYYILYIAHMFISSSVVTKWYKLNIHQLMDQIQWNIWHPSCVLLVNVLIPPWGRKDEVNVLMVQWSDLQATGVWSSSSHS